MLQYTNGSPKQGTVAITVIGAGCFSAQNDSSFSLNKVIYKLCNITSAYSLLFSSGEGHCRDNMAKKKKNLNC